MSVNMIERVLVNNLVQAIQQDKPLKEQAAHYEAVALSGNATAIFETVESHLNGVQQDALEQLHVLYKNPDEWEALNNEQEPENVVELPPKQSHSEALAQAEKLHNMFNGMIGSLNEVTTQVLADTTQGNEQIDAAFNRMASAYWRGIEQRTLVMRAFCDAIHETKELMEAVNSNRDVITLGATPEKRALEAILRNANPMHTAKTIRTLAATDKVAAKTCIHYIKAVGREADYIKHLGSRSSLGGLDESDI